MCNCLSVLVFVLFEMMDLWDVLTALWYMLTNLWFSSVFIGYCFACLANIFLTSCNIPVTTSVTTLICNSINWSGCLPIWSYHVLTIGSYVWTFVLCLLLSTVLFLGCLSLCIDCLLLACAGMLVSFHLCIHYILDYHSYVVSLVLSCCISWHVCQSVHWISSSLAKHSSFWVHHSYIIFFQYIFEYYIFDKLFKLW